MRSGGGFRVLTCRQWEAGVGLFNFAAPMLCFGRLFLLRSFWEWSPSLPCPTRTPPFRFCSLERSFDFLQGCQNLAKPTSLVGWSCSWTFFFGRLRLRLEWSDWSAQGARLLDAIGTFKPHTLRTPLKRDIVIRKVMKNYKCLWPFSDKTY